MVTAVDFFPPTDPNRHTLASTGSPLPGRMPTPATPLNINLPDIMELYTGRNLCERGVISEERC